MKRWTSLILLMTLLLTLVPWSRTDHAVADNLSVSVKLVNYLGKPRDIQLSIKGNVRIKEEPSITLSENENYTITSGQDSLTLSSGTTTIHTFSQSFTLTPVPYGTNNVTILNQRPYLGDICFTLEDQHIRPINTLPLEDYLKGVIPSEMPASWATEALKAQAIAARTFTMTKINRTIDDTTNYQVYNGYRWAASSTAAVDQTSGQTLLEPNGAYAQAVYSSSNGGMTEASQNVWGQRSIFSYLTAKVDPYDPKIPWTLSYRTQQLPIDQLDLAHPEVWWNQINEVDPAVTKNIKNWLYRNGFENTDIKIKSIPYINIADSKTTGKRSLKGSLTIEFFVRDTNGYKMENELLKTYQVNPQLSVDKLRSLLDPISFKSNLVDSIENDGQICTIKGFGFGHGVGMSQYGAKVMAEQGKNSAEILDFYYPGTHLSTPAQDQNPLVPTDASGNPTTPVNQPFKTEIEEVKAPIVPRPPVANADESSNSMIVNLRLNGKTVLFPDQQPYIEVQDHRTMVPIRFISESLGSRVTWDTKNQTATITQGKNNISLKIGSNTAKINEQAVPLDAKAAIKSGRTFVPLRFITETFGGKVSWEPQTKTVVLVVH